MQDGFRFILGVVHDALRVDRCVFDGLVGELARFFPGRGKLGFRLGQVFVRLRAGGYGLRERLFHALPALVHEFAYGLIEQQVKQHEGHDEIDDMDQDIQWVQSVHTASLPREK